MTLKFNRVLAVIEVRSIDVRFHEELYTSLTFHMFVRIALSCVQQFMSYLVDREKKLSDDAQ